MTIGGMREGGKALALAAAVFVLAAVPVVFTRFDGGVAFIWPASSLLLAYLAAKDVKSWPLPILTCGLALMAEVVFFGLGWRGAPVLAPALLLEPALAALILCPVLKVGVDTQSVSGMTWFIGIAGLLAPLLSGVPAAWVVASITGTGYRTDLVHWIAAHFLGAIIFTPICATLVSGNLLVHLRHGDHLTALKTAVMLGLVALTTVMVFQQSTLPLLFVPLLPMSYATLQGGRAGAALGVIVVALVGAIQTAHGYGPITLIVGTTGARWLFLQAYVACAALLVLPIAALLAERSKLVASWRESEARFRGMAESLGDAAIDIAPDGLIRYASPAIAEIADKQADALIGTPARDLVCEEDQSLVNAAFQAAIERPGTATVVQYRGPVRDDGTQRWFEASVRALLRDGIFVGVLGSVRDISERKAVEFSLARDAHLDPLTGLMNRRAFMRELEARCAQVASGQGQGSLALFDLDHFKAVNDRYGHPVGDIVLKGVAGATNALVRGGDCLARIGGEEFALLLWGAGPEAAAGATERLRRAIEKLVFDGGSHGPFSITTSLGLATLSPDILPADALKVADAALYDAKRAGRNCLKIAA